MPVIVPLLFAVAAWRNYSLCLHRFFYVGDDLVRIVAFVSNHCLGLALAQQFSRRRVITDLPASDQKVQRQAQFVDQQVNLGRQSTAGTPQSLVAPFWLPVAACW